MKIYLANQINTSLYKIGVTKKEPQQRLLELQTGNPDKINLIASFETKFNFKLEAALHQHYRLKRINQEWFELEQSDVNEFLGICQKMENNFQVLKDYKNPFF